MNYWNEASNEDEYIFEQASLVVALVGEYAVNHVCKEPCRTSELTGHAWVKEVLQGNPTRCHEMFRMENIFFINFALI